MNHFIEPITTIQVAGIKNRSAAKLDQEPLSALVLKTRADRLLVADLREQTDFKSEYALDPGLAALEDRKDEVGMVIALLHKGEAIATIRFIPSGYGLTLTERFWSEQICDSAILGTNSWEVGRLVMAPQYRCSNLLTPSLALALSELLQHQVVQHMHGSCLMRMTRLYRRFGFQVHAQRTHGTLDCALIHASLAATARAFKLDMSCVTNTPRPFVGGSRLQ